MRIAFSSCQQYGVGYFGAHDHASRIRDLDLYVFLGDYVYEMPGPQRTNAVRDDPITAVDILRGFNAPGGAARTTSEQVARVAVSVAAEAGPRRLVALFADAGPQAIDALRVREATSPVPWPVAGSNNASHKKSLNSTWPMRNPPRWV